MTVSLLIVFGSALAAAAPSSASSPKLDPPPLVVTVPVVEESQAAKPAESSGVTREDAERLRAHLASAAIAARDQRIASGISVMSIGAIFAGGSALVATQSTDPQANKFLGQASYLFGGLGVVTGLSLFIFRSEQEALYDDFRAFNFADETETTRAVQIAEVRLLDLSNQRMWLRRASGGALVGTGLLAGGAGIYGIGASQTNPSLRALSVTGLTVGVLAMADGLLQLLLYQDPVERLLETYRNDPAVKQRRGLPKVDAMGLAPMGRDGLGFALGGRF